MAPSPSNHHLLTIHRVIQVVSCQQRLHVWASQVAALQTTGPPPHTHTHVQGGCGSTLQQLTLERETSTSLYRYHTRTGGTTG